MTFFKVNTDKIKFDFWLKDLKSNKQKAVISALYSVNHIENPDHDKIVEALEKLLTHGDPVIRHSALVAVLEYDNGAINELFPQIELMTEDSSSMVREAAVIATGKTDKNTETLLKNLLDSKHNEVRYQAVISAAEKNYQSLIPDIENLLLNDSDSQVRTNAAIALGDLKAENSISKLLNAAKNDDSFSVRYEAAVSAGFLGENSVVPILLNFMKKDKNLIMPVCDLLGNLKHPDIERAMNKIVSKFGYSTQAKLYAAAVLAKHGDNSVQNFMTSKLKSFFFETRIVAIDRLAYTGKKWAAEALVQSLNIKDELFKDSIFISLIKFFSPEDRSEEQNIFVNSLMSIKEPLRSETLKQAKQTLESQKSDKYSDLIKLISQKLEVIKQELNN